MKDPKEIVQRCKKCNTLFKITILETNQEDPLGYCLACPSCSASGYHNVIHEPQSPTD